jgi:hypothetical protein
MLLRLVFAASWLCLRGSAQTVISSHSGLIYSSEGVVSIDGRAVSQANGRFTQIQEGSLLTTQEGRAEILIAPEAALWLDRYSAIRMQRDSLEDTRIELVQGSAFVQSMDLRSGNSATLIHNSSEIRISAHSLYRVDAASRLSVLGGQAIVTDGKDNLVVTKAHSLDFSARMVTPLSQSDPDEFDRWTTERRRVMAAERARMEASADPKRIRRRRARPYPAIKMQFPRRTS